MSDMSSSPLSLDKGRISGQDTTPNIRQEQSQLSTPATSKDFSTSPQLELRDFGFLPFSHSFSGLFGLNDSTETGCQDNSWQQIDPDMSYNIEQITNIKDFDPQWEHDEIDEIVVMKRKPKSWKISKGGTQRVTIANFDMLHSSENIGGRTIAVTLGRHRQTSRLYAIKTLPFSSTKERNDARLERYIFDTLKPLNNPSLPRLHWTFEHEHHVYFVMDFNPGHDLLTQITSGGRWGIERCRVHANELVSAISALHDVGIIHGDLRPESILFKSDGHLVVTDFNFSFVHDSSMRPSQPPVKNHYKAPEILLGWRYDFSVDCWAFGILLYMMLFGTSPFTNTNGGLGITDNVLNSTTTYSPTIGFSDSSASELVAKCLEPNPAMRPKIHDIRSHSFLSPNTGRRRKMYNSRNESLKASAKFAKKIESLGVKLGSPLSSTSFPRLFGRRPLPPKINVDRPLPPIPVENIEHSPRDTTVKLSHDRLLSFVGPEPDVAPASVHVEFSEDVSDKEAEKKAARDRFWDTISMQNVSVSSARSVGIGEAPGHRGQPSAGSLRLLSVIADTSLNATSRLRKRLRPKENALMFNVDHHRTSTPLPTGLEKIGNGIGFSHADPSCLASKVHSRRATPGLGRTMLRAGLTTFRHGLGLDKLPCIRRETKREQDTPVVTCGSTSDCSSNTEVNITLPFSLAQGIDRSPTSDSFVFDGDDGSNIKFGEMTTLRLVACPNSPFQVGA